MRFKKFDPNNHLDRPTPTDPGEYIPRTPAPEPENECWKASACRWDVTCSYFKHFCTQLAPKDIY